MTGLRVVLAADEAAGRRAMDRLARSTLQLVAVAATPSSSGDAHSLQRRAARAGVRFLSSARVTSPEVVPELVALAPDVLLNVHSLHKVHGDVLGVFGVGAWNLHPGPLPEAAGINVPSWAIAGRHDEHGVTVHEMTEIYDAGAIAYEDRFPIRPGATGLTLSAECATRGLRLLDRLIDQLATDPGGVPRIGQDLSERRFFGTGQPNDGTIDWSAPAAEIEAHVRAADFRPFPSPWSPPVAVVAGERRGLVEVAIEDPVAGGVAPGDAVVDRSDETRRRVAAADRWVRLVETTEVR